MIQQASSGGGKYDYSKSWSRLYMTVVSHGFLFVFDGMTVLIGSRKMVDDLSLILIAALSLACSISCLVSGKAISPRFTHWSCLLFHSCQPQRASSHKARSDTTIESDGVDDLIDLMMIRARSIRC